MDVIRSTHFIFIVYYRKKEDDEYQKSLKNLPGNRKVFVFYLNPVFHFLCVFRLFVFRHYLCECALLLLCSTIDE